MRIAWALCALLLCTVVRGESPKQGEMVETPTSKGVIIDSSTVSKTRLDWGMPGVKVSYWTPSRRLVENAERKLAAIRGKVHAADAVMPEGTSHLNEYYTPKYYSRDRVTHVPEFFYDQQYDIYSLYGMESTTDSSSVRQYLGISINGEKILLVKFMDTSKADWKSRWADKYGWDMYYFIAPDGVTPTTYFPVDLMMM